VKIEGWRKKTLFLFILFAPLEKLHWYLYFAIKPVIILTVIGGFIYVTYTLLKTEISRSAKNVIFIFLLIQIANLLSFYNSINITRSYRVFVLYFIFLVLILIIVSLIKSNRELYFFYNAWIAVGIFLAIYGFIQILGEVRGVSVDDLVFSRISYKPVDIGLGAISSFGYRINSFFGDSNNYCAYLTTVIPLSFTGMVYYLNQKKNKLFYFYFLAFILNLGASFLTFSRSGWLGIFISFIVILFLTRKFVFNRKFLLLCLLLIIVLLIIILPYKDAVINILKVRFGLIEIEEGSANIHFFLYKGALSMFLDHPFIGVGLGNYGIVLEQKGGYQLPGNVLYNPHSAYLSWLSETGIIGFICNIFLIIFMFMILKRYRKKSDGIYKDVISIGLFGGLTGLLVSNIFYQSYTYFFFIVFEGIILSITNILNREYITEVTTINKY